MEAYAYRIDGSFGHERLTIKRFPDNQAWWKFQNRQSDNAWREIKESMPHKAGVYAFAGGQWHNVKDRSIRNALPHI